MTQVLTGHGVFGEYLIKIRREVTSICHHCQEEEDMAQHTLKRCPAWEEPRRILRLTIGDRLAPEAIIEGPTGVSHRPQLLRASNTSEGAGGEEQGEEKQPHQSGSPKRIDTTPHDCGTTTTAVIEERDEGAVRLRRIWTPPQTCTTAQGMRH
jgi:hypothetical protein